MNDNEAKLFALLRDRHPAPEWALLAQVGSETGDARSYADAVAMNLWRSRGFALHAFEFKSYRGDLLRELKNPAKAENVGRYCDFFWIVAGSEDVLKGDKPVPEAWGVLVVKDAKLKQVHPASKLEAAPVGRQFLAAVLRRVHEQLSDEAQLATEFKRGQQVGYKQGEEGHDFHIHRLTEEHDKLNEAVREFEKASGLHISQYGDMKQMGEAVRVVLQLSAENSYGSAANRLNGLARNVEDTAAILRSSADEFLGLLEPVVVVAP